MRVGIGALLLLLLLWPLLAWRPIVTPSVDPVGPVDAVYVLGPAENRMPAALTMVEGGASPLLLATISVDPVTGQEYPRDYCGSVTEDYRVECVSPEPYSTRGEARLLGDRSSTKGWDRVAVVTSTPHAARARLLFERCTSAEVLIWTVDEERGLRAWADEFVYQSAAWVKTQVLRGC